VVSNITPNVPKEYFTALQSLSGNTSTFFYCNFNLLWLGKIFAKCNKLPLADTWNAENSFQSAKIAIFLTVNCDCLSQSRSYSGKSLPVRGRHSVRVKGNPQLDPLLNSHLTY